MSRLPRAALALISVGSLCASPVLQAPARADSVTLQLKDAGSSPRQHLRFAPAVGHSEQVRMEMVMSTEMAMGAMAMPAMKLPPMYLDMDVSVLDIEADGDIRYEFTIAGTSIGEDPDAMPGVGDAMNQAMAPMVGTRGVVLVSATGENKEAELTPAAGADPKMVEDMQRGMANTSAPVPTEKVGVGAKWDLVQAVENQGLVVQQVATYEILELSAESVTLGITLNQDAGSQAFAPEGMPPGSTATLDSMKTRGTGQTVLRFDRVMPLQSSVDVHTDMAVTISAQGQQMPMTTKMDMKTVIGPR